MASIIQMRKVCRFASSLRWFSTNTTINDELCIAHAKRDIENAEKIVSEADDKTYALNASIYWACRFQTADVVNKLMMNKGTEILFKNVDEDNQSFLHMACWNGDLEVIKLLFRKSTMEKHFQIAEMSDKNHITPLHVAVSNGKFKAVDLLLDNGAPLDIANMGGRCPHQSAARYGHTQILGVLLKKGSKIEAVDYNGDSLVHLAASSGKSEVLRYLWSENVDIHITNTKTGEMPIHKAAAIHPFAYRTGALEFLISKGAKLDAEDKRGNRPIDLAKNSMDHYLILKKQMRKQGLDEKQQEIPLPSVFISYRRLDEQKEFTERFVKQLEERNITVWIDDDRIPGGKKLVPTIVRGINNSDIFVCVLSDEFFTSVYCQNELDFAHNAKKRVFPIEWNGCSLSDEYQFTYGGICRHTYNPQENADAEVQKCVDAFMKMVDVEMKSDASNEMK